MKTLRLQRALALATWVSGKGGVANLPTNDELGAELDIRAQAIPEILGVLRHAGIVDVAYDQPSSYVVVRTVRLLIGIEAAAEILAKQDRAAIRADIAEEIQQRLARGERQSAIADLLAPLGVTASSVAGIASRMRRDAEVAAIKSSGPAEPTVVRFPAISYRRPAPIKLPRHKTCQFISAATPTGSDADFCGAPVQPGSSYCPACHAICWVPAPKPARPYALQCVATGQRRA